MRETLTTLVADEEYPSPDLLDGADDVPTLSLVAISDDAVPVQAVDDETLAVLAVRVAAEFFAPLIDGKTSMAEMSAQSDMDLDIVRAAIVRLAAQGALTFVHPSPPAAAPDAPR
jgi:hypothetical protein